MVADQRTVHNLTGNFEYLRTVAAAVKANRR